MLLDSSLSFIFFIVSHSIVNRVKINIKQTNKQPRTEPPHHHRTSKSVSIAIIFIECKFIVIDLKLLPLPMPYRRIYDIAVCYIHAKILPLLNKIYIYLLLFIAWLNLIEQLFHF